MRKVLVCVLVAACAALYIGCSGSNAGKSASEKEFERIYKQYSARFYEKMTTEAETMKPVQVMMESARIWDDPWAGHKDILLKRSEEILSDLDTATPIKEDLYNEVASGARVEPAADQPQGIVLKQFLWSPIGAAQMGLNNWLARLLHQESFAMRSVMTANASLFWEAIDRNVDHPKLAMRQGPMIFIVDLTRKDDYYQVDKVRWLRPKAMGPMVPPTAPTGTAPAAAPAAPAAAPAAPAAAPAAPVAAPAAPAAPAEKK